MATIRSWIDSQAEGALLDAAEDRAVSGFVWPVDYVASQGKSHSSASTGGGPSPRDEWFVRPDLVDFFKHRGWDSTLAVLRDSLVTVLRQANGREICRTTWTDPRTGQLRLAFVKRFHHSSEPSAGWDEANSVGSCQAAGVACSDVLAAGRIFNEQGDCTGSVFITAAVSHFSSDREGVQEPRLVESLSLFVLFFQQHLLTNSNAEVVIECREWLRQLARTVSQLHVAQLTHGDLYLHHAYPKAAADGETEVALIDLELLRRSTGVTFWYLWIKDLWQLRFSLDRLQADAGTVQHWYECYFANGSIPQPLTGWQTLLTGLIRISRPRRLLKLWLSRWLGRQEVIERAMLPYYRGEVIPTTNPR